MIPEYLLWKLCGVKAREYTNATSTGLRQRQIREYDPEILSALGLPETMFPPLTAPGTVLGPLKPEIASEVGGQTNVVLCATHDTASAVEGIPMEQGGGTVPFFRHLGACWVSNWHSRSPLQKAAKQISQMKAAWATSAI